MNRTINKIEKPHNKKGGYMKSTEKDVLMICKGHYDHRKYKTIKEALDEYYRKNYRVSKEIVPELSYHLIVNFFLNECIKTFITTDTISCFLYKIILEETLEEKIKDNVSTEFYKILYYRIVKWLSSLRVMDKHDNWIIDLSDYKVYEDIV